MEEKKNYTLDILYDNGKFEQFQTGEITAKDAEDFLIIFYKSFKEGLEAVVQIPNGSGGNAIINVAKVTRISFLP